MARLTEPARAALGLINEADRLESAANLIDGVRRRLESGGPASTRPVWLIGGTQALFLHAKNIRRVAATLRALGANSR